jgi:F-type H+-transporting ATPase subunit epsilon
MLLEVITPDQVLFRGNVSHVVLPGLDGSFGVLSNHAPMISALTKGEMKVEQILEENKSDEFDGKYNVEFKNEAAFNFEINGGIIEVKDNKIIVLAE